MASAGKPTPSQAGPADRLLAAGRTLSRELAKLRFGPPVAHVYDPLDYAWEPYRNYVQRYGTTPKRVIFLGMNPGPFGMVQTGVPFGEVAAVRDWLKISGSVLSPASSHPKRPVQGFDCTRSEVSGERLWGLFRQRYGAPERFFTHHFVLNYCPLAFVEETGRNRTPDKLTSAERDPLFAACDRHLRKAVEALEPEWAIGIGDFARERLAMVLEGMPVKLGKILHPSPASPAANRDWAGAATRQMTALGLWA